MDSVYTLFGGPHDGKKISAEGPRIEIPDQPLHPSLLDIDLSRSGHLLLPISVYELRNGKYVWIH